MTTVQPILEVKSPRDFDRWLKKHGRTEWLLWVVLFKKSTGKQTVTFDHLLESALSYGWIDNQEKSLDAERYAIRFTPRRPGSTWSPRNREIARRLIAEGRMTAAGRATLPDDL